MRWETLTGLLTGARKKTRPSHTLGRADIGSRYHPICAGQTAPLKESNNSRPITWPNGDTLLTAPLRLSGPGSEVIGLIPGPYAHTDRTLSGGPLWTCRVLINALDWDMKFLTVYTGGRDLSSPLLLTFKGKSGKGRRSLGPGQYFWGGRGIFT